MSDLFNPQSARYRRGSYIVSMYCGAFVTMGLILSDFGAQEHILSPVQRYTNDKIDKFFGVTAAELKIVNRNGTGKAMWTNGAAHIKDGTPVL